MTDLLGRPAILRLTPGNVADVTMAGDLMYAAGPVRCLIADKGYDANAQRKRLKTEGATAVIPGRSNRKKPIRYDEGRYRGRWRIEAAFCRLKDFRRIATRYGALASGFVTVELHHLLGHDHIPDTRPAQSLCASHVRCRPLKNDRLPTRWISTRPRSIRW